MKNPCLGQIPSQEKFKQDKTTGAQLMGAPSFFAIDHQKREHNMCHKSYKNFIKNLDINVIKKEFWFPKILSHRI